MIAACRKPPSISYILNFKRRLKKSGESSRMLRRWNGLIYSPKRGGLWNKWSFYSMSGAPVGTPHCGNLL